MNNNNKAGMNNLHDLVGDLSDVYGLMSELSLQLQGGGIVQARDIEPSVAKAVPKLRRVVAALQAASTNSESGEEPLLNQNPLLM